MIRTILIFFYHAHLVDFPRELPDSKSTKLPFFLLHFYSHISTTAQGFFIVKSSSIFQWYINEAYIYRKQVLTENWCIRNMKHQCTIYGIPTIWCTKYGTLNELALILFYFLDKIDFPSYNNFRSIWTNKYILIMYYLRSAK